MQKWIVIPAEQYYKMLQSYDKAMKELEDLRQLMCANKKAPAAGKQSGTKESITKAHYRAD